MDVALRNVNMLPVRTWNRLGINDTGLQEKFSDPAPYRGKALAGSLPEGVSLTKKPFPVPDAETGMGKDTADFVESHSNCGVSLCAAAGTKAEKPVVLNYEISEKNPTVIDCNEITAEEGSEITVVMGYRSEGDVPGFHGGLTKLYAGKGAVIHLMQIQLLGDGCTHFDNVGAFAEEGGKIDIVQAELGGKHAFSGVKTRLGGTKSQLNMNAIYLGDHQRSIDINYIAQHTGRKTSSNINVSGALLDESQKTFRGTIDFVRGAKQAVGHENEYNLLFSPKVRNRTAPLILCQEEDVDGQHAASTGRIDAARLFYLMSRGLSEAEAKKLIIEAQFHPVIDRIPDMELKKEVSDFVKGRLSQLESMG